MSHTSQIRRRWALDDDTVEAIVQSRPIDGRFDPLVAFARQVRTAAVDLPGPAPSDELARILRGDTKINQETHSMDVGRFAAIAARVASLGTAARIGLGAAIAAASVAGAGAAGALPGPANDAVRGAIETVSPVDFADEAPEHPENFGDEVSDDATGGSDGENGVDGQQISEEAPGADHRPDSAGSSDEGPGQPDSTGLDRADETPAEPHAPDSVPSGNGGDGNGGQPEVIPSTVPSLPDQSQGHGRP
ncbi:MAG TPA: hypothetical protein VK611_02145 [Acidimicrobiales bacterium]|nr:hypothetical protein [Acidimicrobiales bacterium]